jgi:hypothetical protein
MISDRQWFQRLKLQYAELHSNVAVNFNLRHYGMALRNRMIALEDVHDRLVGRCRREVPKSLNPKSSTLNPKP